MADFGFGFDSSGDGSGGGFSYSDLASSLIQVGGQLGSQAILANANPTNVALISGQGVMTPTLTTSGVPTSAHASISGLGLLVLAAIGVGLFFLVRG